MDTTIEREFFKAYEYGGIVSTLIKEIRDIYNIPKEFDDKNTRLLKPWEIEAIDREAPTEIMEETEFFENVANVYLRNGELMEEIEANLREVRHDEAERIRYLFSVIKPFGWTCFCGESIGGFTTPIERVNSINKEAERISQEMERYGKLPPDAEFYSEQHEEWFGLADILEVYLNDYETKLKQLEWLQRTIKEINMITSQQNPYTLLNGTTDHCLYVFYQAFCSFANKLNALLLTYGIDLMELQETSGYYLLPAHNTVALTDILGSVKLVEYYRARLPHSEPQQQVRVKEYIVPTKLDIGEARKYINRAIEKGWIEIKDNRGKWLFGGTSRLAYFCQRVYSQPRPIGDLERFFDVKGLAGTISNIENEDKDKVLRNDVRIWREEMDNVLFYD